MLFDLTETVAAPPERRILAEEFTGILGRSRKGPASGSNGDAVEHATLGFEGHGVLPPGMRPKAPAAPAAPERRLTTANRLQFEKELLGFYVSGHPLAIYEGLAEALDTFPASELSKQPGRTEFRLCGIVSGVVKKLSKKDNRPWAAFTFSTRKAAIPLNMFADAYAIHGALLVENAPVLILGNVIAGPDGARINAKECYPLEGAVAAQVRKVTWLLDPAGSDVVGFLRQLRQTVDSQPGDTRTEFAFVFPDRATPIAEASTALGWRINPAAFCTLRTHAAVCGAHLETKRLEFKQDRRWTRK